MATIAVVAGTTLVLSQVYERKLRETLLEEAETRLLLDARNLAALGSNALLAEFPELTLVPLVRDMQSARPELSLVVIVDHAGLIRGALDPRAIGTVYPPPVGLTPLADRPFLSADETLAMDDAVIQATTRVNHPVEGRIGRVIVSLERRGIEARIRAERATMLKVAGVMLIVALALSLGVMHVLFQPIDDLQRGLRRIGQGDLDQPLVVRGTSELRGLGEALNEMAARLKESQSLAAAREAEIVETQREVIMTLGEVVESRSHETANHTRRVGAMSRELALLAGLPADQAELLRLASPMHDVGKIGIPDSILNKPGKLTDAEYTIMKTHAEIGHSILVGSERPMLNAAAVIAHQHHERWDGKGYPRGLQGTGIHEFGRIVSLVDVFDALASDRVYRPAMPLDKVLTIIHEGRGTQFDPELVDLFLAHLDRFLAISRLLSDDADVYQPTVETPADGLAEGADSPTPEPVPA
jgi:putative two-component system response regulator